ncbi:helix-turn-helix transcriptional regulator [Phenylobacterium sp.]|jgi:transcriptional regulator with XRE-family HTH domain|uniref:helix-turn-helix domain-containing protein n=1 Tax=Phenylobacterium sp. TaxID=1871053 RepID=UPI002E2F6869|nr:helix-turn-helix transcriptional regulator [Phenylobacterium sp.]HEX4709438.1 helix-turn-helix transcriptional regulator [Phenylobacterium sp.]
MGGSFARKLELVLKVLSMSRARLAAGLGVDKSVVGRWVTGAVQPSAHNLSRLSALIAERIAGFTALDWDRSLPAFAELVGADLDGVALDGAGPALQGLPLAQMDLFLAATALRGGAYEGFFRTTRPYVLNPGRFVHDYGMIRRDPCGLLRLRIASDGTVVDGWMLPFGNQLAAICVDITSGALMFGLFNGVGTATAEVVDGLVLAPALDAGRTPTAHAMVFERVGDLTGDTEADDRRLAELAALDPLAPDASIPAALRGHITGDFGPAQAALGGDLLLRLPLSRSLARGPVYREKS